MAFSRFFFVVAASLVLLDSAATAPDDTHTITLTDGDTCFDTMNDARRQAKLKNLQAQHRVAEDPQSNKPTGIWEDVCNTLFDEAEPERDFKPQSVLTEIYALFKLGESANGEDLHATLSGDQCRKAVEEWQKGFGTFEQDSFKKEKLTYEKATRTQVSFVTLYNPADPPNGQCSVTTCTRSDPGRNTPQKVYGLLCSTNPNAFDEETLFKDEEWDNIKDALAPPKEDVQKVTITDGNSCLTKLNAAREEAGLSTLTPDTTLFPVATQTTASGVSKAVCDTLLTGAEFKPPEELISSGSLAVFKSNEESEEGSVEERQTTPTDAQCSAAVEEWQQGFKAFEDDPPVNKGVKYSEANSNQVSFVTLYNPDSKAKGQCSVATCKASKDTGGDGEEKAVSGLVCSTSPNVFGKEPLFTQTQWDSLKNILSSSASTAFPSVISLAALLLAAFFS